MRLWLALIPLLGMCSEVLNGEMGGGKYSHICPLPPKVFSSCSSRAVFDTRLVVVEIDRVSKPTHLAQPLSVPSDTHPKMEQ